MTCNDTHTHCHSCWSKLFEWIRIEWIRTGGIRVERIRIGGICIGGIRLEWICVGYVWCAGICVGYVWNGYVWDTFGMDMCGICVVCWICVGYVWDTFGMDMCGICVVCWICVGYVWCEIRQQSSEEPCDETSSGKKFDGTYGTPTQDPLTYGPTMFLIYFFIWHSGLSGSLGLHKLEVGLSVALILQEFKNRPGVPKSKLLLSLHFQQIMTVTYWKLSGWRIVNRWHQFSSVGLENPLVS